MVTLAVLLLSAAVQGSPCGPAAPAAPTVAEIKATHNMAEVVALAKLADGSAAPASLQPPSFSNKDVVFKYMREHYPAELRTDSVKPDIAMFWACVDTLGKIASPALIGSSGQAPLDTLALQVLRLVQLTPATVDGKKVPVWMPVPVQLSPIASVTPLTSKELAKRPVYTPFTTAPELTNRQQIAEEMKATYPPKLRSSGMGGVVVLWLFIDEKGSVKNTVVKESGGYRELDDFAMGIGAMMRFNPATLNGTKVPVWVSLPLRLRPN